MIKEIECPSVIAEATRMRGDVNFSSESHIYGTIEGDLTQQSNQLLHVGKTGWIHGSVKSQGPVVVEGRVDGHIQATHKILLLPNATVRGRVVAPKVQITAGAIVEGEVKMGPLEVLQPVSQAA